MSRYCQKRLGSRGEELLSTILKRKVRAFLKAILGHQASVIECFGRSAEGGTNGCEGLTGKGDKVLGVTGKGRKSEKRMKNKSK